MRGPVEDGTSSVNYLLRTRSVSSPVPSPNRTTSTFTTGSLPRLIPPTGPRKLAAPAHVDCGLINLLKFKRHSHGVLASYYRLGCHRKQCPLFEVSLRLFRCYRFLINASSSLNDWLHYSSSPSVTVGRNQLVLASGLLVLADNAPSRRSIPHSHRLEYVLAAVTLLLFSLTPQIQTLPRRPARSPRLS